MAQRNGEVSTSTLSHFSCWYRYFFPEWWVSFICLITSPLIWTLCRLDCKVLQTPLTNSGLLKHATWNSFASNLYLEESAPYSQPLFRPLPKMISWVVCTSDFIFSQPILNSKADSGPDDKRAPMWPRLICHWIGNVMLAG